MVAPPVRTSLTSHHVYGARAACAYTPLPDLAKLVSLNNAIRLCEWMNYTLVSFLVHAATSSLLLVAALSCRAGRAVGTPDQPAYRLCLLSSVQQVLPARTEAVLATYLDLTPLRKRYCVVSASDPDVQVCTKTSSSFVCCALCVPQLLPPAFLVLA